jgi:photosystem II stability/assembly factor-like uncharacterized protein
MKNRLNVWSAAIRDANTAAVVGSGGTILHTTDGGVTWSVQSSGTTANLSGACFTDVIREPWWDRMA